MNEPAVLLSYFLSYSLIIGFFVRLVVQDRKLRDRLGDN